MSEKKNISGDHNHPHDHAHSHLPSDPELRVKALETLLLNKGLIDIMYLYRSNKFTGVGSLNVVDKIKNIDDFELFNTVDLSNEKLEIWINKNIKKWHR